MHRERRREIRGITACWERECREPSEPGVELGSNDTL